MTSMIVTKIDPTSGLDVPACRLCGWIISRPTSGRLTDEEIKRDGNAFTTHVMNEHPVEAKKLAVYFSGQKDIRMEVRADLLAAGKHLCHWPTCATVVPPKLWGCRAHWFKIPKSFRDLIWKTYVPGQEERKNPSPEYIDVAYAVQRWIDLEISQGRAT